MYNSNPSQWPVGIAINTMFELVSKETNVCACWIQGMEIGECRSDITVAYGSSVKRVNIKQPKNQTTTLIKTKWSNTNLF